MLLLAALLVLNTPRFLALLLLTKVLDGMLLKATIMEILSVCNMALAFKISKAAHRARDTGSQSPCLLGAIEC